jgi:hypothetical protein
VDLNADLGENLGAYRYGTRRDGGARNRSRPEDDKSIAALTLWTGFPAPQVPADTSVYVTSAPHAMTRGSAVQPTNKATPNLATANQREYKLDDDLVKFQGTWSLVLHHWKGRDVDLGPVTLCFKGDACTATFLALAPTLALLAACWGAGSRGRR